MVAALVVTALYGSDRISMTWRFDDVGHPVLMVTASMFEWRDRITRSHWVDNMTTQRIEAIREPRKSCGGARTATMTNFRIADYRSR